MAAKEGKGKISLIAPKSPGTCRYADLFSLTARGYAVYFDIQTQDLGCATIIKSPASTDIAGCGAVIGAFKQPACALLNLESSFMVQSCCGEDCSSAGAPPLRVGSVRSVSIDGRGSLLLKDANGNLIEPAEVGPPPQLTSSGITKRQTRKERFQHLQKRSCDENSWKGGQVLTRPADDVQIVHATSETGPVQVGIETARTQSWTTSLSLGISDIISLGVSTEFTESVTSTNSMTYTIPAGQTGVVGFTATLSCSTGTGQCDGEEVEGEVCCKYPLRVLDLSYGLIDLKGLRRPIMAMF